MAKMINVMVIQASDDHSKGWAKVTLESGMDGSVEVTAGTTNLIARMTISDARALKECLNKLFPDQ